MTGTAPSRTAAAARPEPARVREWQAPFLVDVRVTLSVQGRGRSDPTFRIDEAGAVWRTSLTPDGPATIRVTAPFPAASAPAGPLVLAQAWGPGADWLLDALPGALGLHDDISGFDPSGHPVLRQVARRHPGLRLGRSGRLMEALVPAVLEQKVLTIEAHRAWRILLAKFGGQPPGPAPRGMRVFPDPKTWRRIPSWDWHRAGVEGVRAQTIIRACTVADSLERLLAKTHEEADRLLRTIPGIGPWTSAETRQRAAGDPDAVSVGDAHLPDMVGWALAGRSATNDEEMLELLGPYAGHRHRVTRLVKLSGLGGPPRRAPKLPVRDYRRF
ncbi:DNA-3-methyladenine glycosylase family protein [Trebonia sp.]|jgi:3-methyladenine DNA glycosylase/8-oxoguanine DNA glycosylase|uniref:DNA-3-methyladenine glycosylase family protein n=1 Tax=Trebonia sp. TaxID=2767075 RepID=UPI003C808890